MNDEPSTSDETHTDEDPVSAKVTITAPGVNITRSVDEATMGSIIGLLFGVTPVGRGVSGSSGGGEGAQLAGGHGAGGHDPGIQGGGTQHSRQWDEDITLGEFISETGATTFQHKICAAGYYLMKIRGAESFTSSDVKAELADAHEDMPANFSRDFGEAASKNYIAKKHGGEAGHFIVPKTGRTAVESKFTDLPARRRARKTAKKATSSGGGE